MSRDMKSNRRSPPPRKGSPLLLGVIIGALIGVGIAVGVALFLNRAPSPFNQQQVASTPSDTAARAIKPADSRPEILQPSGSNVVNAVPDTSTTHTANASATIASHPQSMDYDFYKVLSGHEDKKKKQHASSPDTQLPKTLTTDNPQPSLIKKSYLQLGAFQNEQQADNLKAKLALVGVEAQIQSKDTGTAILHRVRVGPFTSQEALTRMRNQLKQNGIESAIVGG